MDSATQCAKDESKSVGCNRTRRRSSRIVSGRPRDNNKHGRLRRRGSNKGGLLRQKNKTDANETTKLEKRTEKRA